MNKAALIDAKISAAILAEKLLLTYWSETERRQDYHWAEAKRAFADLVAQFERIAPPVTIVQDDEVAE
jgi:hypothetical protein